MDINSADMDCGYWKLKLIASQMMVYSGMGYFINFCLLALWKSSQNGRDIENIFYFYPFLFIFYMYDPLLFGYNILWL